MLKLFAPSDRGSHFCDGISRRNFLKIGGLGAGGLALPQLLAAESRAGTGSSHKSVIMIYLVGGPPHQDMFDLKRDAPSEVAGPMRPIGTNVPGIEICELFPHTDRRQRRAAGAAELPRRAQAGRGRRTRGHRQLQQVGLARR